MNVTFNEPQYRQIHRQADKTTGFGRLIMKLSGGMIKNQKQANAIMTIASIIIFLLSIYFFLT
jgi:hypothetical protein